MLSVFVFNDHCVASFNLPKGNGTGDGSARRTTTLTKLKKLNLCGKRVIETGVRWLSRALADCQIASEVRSELQLMMMGPGSPASGSRRSHSRRTSPRP